MKKLSFLLHKNVPEEVPGPPPAHGKQRNELEYILKNHQDYLQDIGGANVVFLIKEKTPGNKIFNSNFGEQ